MERMQPGTIVKFHRRRQRTLGRVCRAEDAMGRVAVQVLLIGLRPSTQQFTVHVDDLEVMEGTDR